MRLVESIASFAGAALTILMLGGCEDATGPVLPTGSFLQIRPATVRVVEGDSIAFEARVFDESGREFRAPAIEWQSLGPAILEVNGRTAHAMAPGWARVVASLAGDADFADTALVAISIEFQGITAGYNYACGWTPDRHAWCWGPNAADDAPLGHGEAVEDAYGTPGLVVGEHAFTRVDAGRALTCGIADARAYCWGLAYASVIGSDQCLSGACPSPALVTVDAELREVAVPKVDRATACATGPSGLYCWGTVTWGMMGIFPLPCSPDCNPTHVSAVQTGDVTVGATHVCALDAEGRAFCWGDNRFGQLGIGDAQPAFRCGFAETPCAATPIPVESEERFVQLEAGSNFTCGLTADGRVVCWGNYKAFGASYGEAPGPAPVEVSGAHGFLTIGAGWFHACGVNAAAEMYCWGRPGQGSSMGEPKLPLATLVSEPRLVQADIGFTSVDVGRDHTCGVALDGSMRCMGSGWGLGQGFSFIERARPLIVAPPGQLPPELADLGS